MRLHVISDVHLEFQKWRSTWDVGTIDCDVHVLAGDIGVGLSGIAWALEAFTRPMIYVFGNHEYYGQRPMTELLEKAREKVAGTHVHLLENDAVILSGEEGDRVRFIGATLWTDFCIHGPERQQFMMNHAGQVMSDYANIFVTRRGSRYGRNASAGLWEPGLTATRSGDRLTPRKVLSLHHDSRDFIEQELTTASQGRALGEKTVVVTHHAPSARSLPYGEVATPTDAAYASHLDHLVAKTDLWVHGHVHEAREIELAYGGRIAVNCRGYRDHGPESVEEFKWDRVVEI